jgi:hypothetical protein
METKIIPLLASLVLLAGCASPEKIQFSDDAEIARLMPATMPKPPVSDGLEKAEVRQIEAVVFTRLLEQPATADKNCSAVFLQTDEETVTALMQKLPAHIPPIKQAWHLEIRPGQSPLDKDTYRAAMILSVTVSEPENSIVTAVGKWFAGDAVSGISTFEFKKVGGEWVAQTGKP